LNKKKQTKKPNQTNKPKHATYQTKNKKPIDPRIMKPCYPMLKNSPTKTDKQYHFSQSNETDSNSLERQGLLLKAMQYDSMSPMGKSACYPNSVPKNALNLHVQRRAKRLKKRI